MGTVLHWTETQRQFLAVEQGFYCYGLYDVHRHDRIEIYRRNDGQKDRASRKMATKVDNPEIQSPSRNPGGV